MAIDVNPIYDPTSGALTYVVIDAATGQCAVIDSVLPAEPELAADGAGPREAVAALIERRQLTLRWVLETHVHADHLSGAFELKRRFGGTTGIGAGVLEVRRRLQKGGSVPGGLAQSPPPFDRLLADGDVLPLGASSIRVLATPGHTPSCVTYQVEDNLFVGDTLFMPEAGTARCDFPGGSAELLFRSIGRILAFPAGYRVFVAHNYGPSRGEPWRHQSTVGEQLARNIHVHAGATADQFVARRNWRDRTLALPAQFHRAVRFNAFG